MVCEIEFFIKSDQILLFGMIRNEKTCFFTRSIETPKNTIQ
jgi:hypothetical protein